MQLKPTQQLELGFQEDGGEAGSPNLPTAFRRLYYHLYSNSRASRAERIIEDLSLLLLLKLAVEVNGGAEDFTLFRERQASANDTLIPLLRRTYPALVDHHQRFSLGDDALRGALEELEDIRLSAAPAHVIGEAFQALIGPNLRGDKGQFFTPRSLVRSMVQIVDPKPSESVLDPACGTGGFLAEAHAYQVSRANSQSPTGRLVGVDKDLDMCRLASALLQIAARGRATILNINSLDAKQWEPSVGAGAEGLFDVILTNPPFGSRIGIRDNGLLRTFSFGHQWIQRGGPGEWQETAAVCDSQDPQTLFLELCVRRLRPGGRLAIVLPEGMFGNKKTGYVWKWLNDQGRIVALLDCPRTTFQPGTDTKTNVLFFEKTAPGEQSSRRRAEGVWVGVALHCGHDRRGRTRRNDGQPYPDDLAALARYFPGRDSNGSGWLRTNLNRPEYLVPRYYAKQCVLTRPESELTEGANRAALGDLVRDGILSIRKGHEVGSEAYGTGDIPFVRTSDLSNLEIKTDPTVAVGDDVYHRFAAQQRLHPGDILMVADGRYRIGATAILTENNYRCVVQSHLRIMSVLDRDRLRPYELLFALNLPSVRYQIRNLVFVQSTLGTLGKRLLELEIPVLHGPGPWQERIDRFQALLVERDSLLARLTAMGGPAYEL